MEGGDLKAPHVDKIVGIPTEHKAHTSQVEAVSLSIFEKDGRTIKEGFEIEKTERDILIINWLESHIEEYLKKYGGKRSFDIPPGKIHILKDGATEEFTEGALSKGGYSVRTGGIIIDRNTSDVEFAISLAHELIHYGSYQSLQLLISEEGEGFLRQYRSGISINSRDSKYSYLDNLEEGIVELLTENFFHEEIEKSDLFKEEIENLNKVGTKIDFTRKGEREALTNLAKAIWEKNKEEFGSQEEVLRIFIEAQLNGNILRLGKLIEHTFGKGSLRKLAEDSKNTI